MFRMAMYGQLSIASPCGRVCRTAMLEIQAGCLLQRTEHVLQIIHRLCTESVSKQSMVILRTAQPPMAQARMATVCMSGEVRLSWILCSSVSDSHPIWLLLQLWCWQIGREDSERMVVTAEGGAPHPAFASFPAPFMLGGVPGFSLPFGDAGILAQLPAPFIQGGGSGELTER